MRAAHVVDNNIVNILIVDNLSFPVKEGFLVEDTGDESVGGWAQIGGTYINQTFIPPKPSNEEQELNRRVAYEVEADPLFFKAQRGEATQEEWLAKVAEIKNRYPKD